MNRILALRVCLGLVVSSCLCIPLSARAAVLTGLWEFDDPLNLGRASVGIDLGIAGAAPAFNAALADDVGNTLSGVITTSHGLPDYLAATHDIPPNGGGVYVNDYSIMIDLFSPAESRNQWRCLFQTNPTNGNDGDYFIRPDNRVGVSALTYSTNVLDPTRWTRLVLTFDLDSSIRTYVNGTLFHTHALQPIDGRFALDPILLFFGDEDLENFPLNVGAVAIWDGSLTPQEVAALGPPGAPMPAVLVPPPQVFESSENLPPFSGYYVSPSNYHQLYPNGVSVTNIHHYSFDRSDPPPPPGITNEHTFNSLVDMDVSLDGVNFTRITAPATVRVRVSRSTASSSNAVFETEMVQLDISGGGLPPGVRLRESPTRRSTGRTTELPVAGGFLVSSYFDIFTEVSLNNGATWTPAFAPGRMQLIGAPTLEIFQPSPGGELPPRHHCGYVSHREYHQQYNNGYSVRDILHHEFDDSEPPPGDGQSSTHYFNSYVEMDVHTDPIGPPVRVRAPAVTQVQVQHVRTIGGMRFFDTEMMFLDIRGGGLPAGVAVRESPTRVSRGRTTLRPANGGVLMSSYFDIFTELTLDGGATWSAADQPARVELTPTRVFINEWLAVNANSIADPDYGGREDWFELYNPNPYPINLTGHYLANNLAMTNLFEIGTNWAVSAHGRMLVWADGRNQAQRGPVTELHTHFRLNNGGGALGLFSRSGEAIDTITFGPQLADRSEGRCPDGAATQVFMTVPTPRTSNLCIDPGGRRLSVRRIGGMIEVSWSPAGGTLQQADKVKGPWANVAGATNPFLTPRGAAPKFYRVVQ